MRTKFICSSVEDFGEQKQDHLSAVTGGSEENDSFNKFTPAGQFAISINKEGAMDYFKPGKEYYLDFSEAGE